MQASLSQHCTASENKILWNPYNMSRGTTLSGYVYGNASLLVKSHDTGTALGIMRAGSLLATG